MVQAVRDLIDRLGVRPSIRFAFVVFLLTITVFTGMATGFDLFYRLSYVLIATIVVSYVWVLLMLRSVRVEVVGRPRQARAGDEILETITVENRGALPTYALEVSDLTDIPGHRGGVAMSVSGRSSVSWTMHLRARTRGLYHLGPIRSAARDVFGIFSKAREFGVREEIMVFPKTFDLPGFEVPDAQLHGDSSTRQRSQNVTPHAASVRDYAPGDALSRVHWNSTARMGKLMSKEFDLGRASEVWILVDLDRSVQAGELEESTDEYGVTIAASMVKRHLAADLPVGLVAFGDKRYFLPAETGVGHGDRMMEYLALAKASGETPIHEALADYEPLWGHNATLIVVTSSPRTDWVIGMGELMRRGVRATVILLDGQSFGGGGDAAAVKEEMFARGIPHYEVRQGDDIPSRLLAGGAVRGAPAPAESSQEALAGV